MLKEWLKNKIIEFLRKDIENLFAEKIQQLDLPERAIRSEEKIEDLKKCIDDPRALVEKIDLQGRLVRIENNVRKLNQKLHDPYEVIDYGDFENHFRGSRELIKNRQKEYLPYFKEKKQVLDLGCGRGEFLELMKEQGIQAEGVDLYKPFVKECLQMGLDVHEGDAIEYLGKKEKVDAIFAGQIAEHLSIEQLIQLCKIAYEKLEQGGCFVVETPNPMSLAIFAHAFYIDPSHNKPVHPLSLQYYLQKAGFSNIKILFTENSKLGIESPKIDGGNSGIDFEKFNKSMNEVEKYLFGSQDYAIIAIK